MAAKSCPIVPRATAADLAPLVEHLASDRPLPASAGAFPRGTLHPDGRLDLCKAGLGPEGAWTVARALEKNTVVKHVLLGADALGDEGARAVGWLLRHNEWLETVFLGCNRIGVAGTRELSEAVGAHRSVRALWLKRNAIGDDGARELARALGRSRRVRTLDLVGTSLTREAARAIVEALLAGPRLERLYLGGNDLSPRDAEVVRGLLAEDHVASLFLSNNHLGNEGARSLAGSLREGLVELDLAANAIEDDGIAALVERLPASVERLELGTPSSAKAYDARPNAIGPRATRALARLIEERTALRSLGLGGVRIDASAADELLVALERRATPLAFALGPLGGEQRARHTELLRRRPPPPWEKHPDVRAIASGGRAGKKSREPAPVRVVAPVASAEPASVPVSVSPEELARCAETLAALARSPHAFLDKKNPALARVRAEANRLISSIQDATRAARETRATNEGRAARSKRQAHDRAVARSATIRGGTPESGLQRIKPAICYVCKGSFTEAHAFYDALCPACGATNQERRGQTADLTGRVALVTGGRVKIGYRIALKLLRAGARTIVTTRFPCDAARRFAAESDFDAWRDRLAIHGLDLRNLVVVDRFATDLARELDRLDVLVDNAAQTILRPPSYYAPLLSEERTELLAPPVRALVLRESAHELGGTAAAEGSSGGDVAFPRGVLGLDGEPIDLRAKNSWTLPVDEVSLAELVGAHAVSALAPFVLLSRLLPVLRRSPASDRYVVHVSAMEGRFDHPTKQPFHPHTNMAKASLHMLTRTVGESLAREGIYVTAVDTGWITDEQPAPVAVARRAREDFVPPLDVEDGAARVLDPVFRGVSGGARLAGVLLKDYRPVSW